MLHWHHYIKILCIIYLYVIYFVYAISKWCTITFLFCLPATAPATVVSFLARVYATCDQEYMQLAIKNICNLCSALHSKTKVSSPAVTYV